MKTFSAGRRFALLVMLAAVVWRHALAATFMLALGNEAYTHILLILPISIVLIFPEVTSRKGQFQPDLPVGLTLVLVAALIGFIGSGRWVGSSLPADVQLSLQMLAVITWWIGSFVWCFGNGLFRRCLFPLCFLLWLVPVPHSVLNYVVSFLQHGSASAARMLFTAVGVPVSQDGVQLSIPGLTVEVADECSSIRSSLMLLVTTMVLAHLMLRSAWGKVVVVLAAIPLCLAKNGLRIFALSMLTVYVDPGYLHGRLHHNGGIVFFLLSLAGLAALLWLIRQAERRMKPQSIVSSITPLGIRKDSLQA